MKRRIILKEIDKLNGYENKLEYLNGLFLKANNQNDENMILSMIEQLKQWGN